MKKNEQEEEQETMLQVSNKVISGTYVSSCLGTCCTICLVKLCGIGLSFIVVIY